MKTLKVSLIGTVVGLAAWGLGIGHILWPVHPQLAGFRPCMVNLIRNCIVILNHSTIYRLEWNGKMHLGAQ